MRLEGTVDSSAVAGVLERYAARSPTRSYRSDGSKVALHFVKPRAGDVKHSMAAIEMARLRAHACVCIDLGARGLCAWEQCGSSATE